MWRLAFLFLVVIGALAVVLGLVAGIGMWQAARLQSAAETTVDTRADTNSVAATSEAPAGGSRPPSTQPVVTRAAASNTPAEGEPAGRPAPAGSGDGGDAKSPPDAGRRPAGNGDQADWPPPDPAAGGRARRLPPDRAGGDVLVPVPAAPDRLFPQPDPRFPRPGPLVRGDGGGGEVLVPAQPRLAAVVPGTRPPIDPDAKPLVLDAASAAVHGDGGLHVGGGDGAKTLVGWRADADSATWSLDVPTTGMYLVELEYACDRQAGGGMVWVQFNQSLAARLEVRLTQTVRPTNGWDDYRTVTLGLTYLPAGKTDVLVRPLQIKADHELMNLRAVRLKLTKDERRR